MTTPRIRALVRTTSRLASLPVLGLLAGLIAAAVATAVLTPTYEATSSVIVLPSPTGDKGVVSVVDVSLAQTLTSSVARLAESRNVSTAVARALKVPEGRVAGHLTAVAQLGIQIVTVTASAETGADAAALADAAAAAMADLATRLNLGGSTVSVRPLDTAGVPGAPTSPRRGLNLALGAVVGLLVGIGATSLRTRLGGRFRRVADIEVDLGLPALGVIRQRAPGPKPVSAARLYARPELAASVDGLVSALGVLVPKRHGRRIVITSVDEEESAAFVAALLVVALHHPGHPATLLEGQLVRSTVGRYFPEHAAASVDDLLGRRTTITGLDVDPAPSVLSIDDVLGRLVTEHNDNEVGMLVDAIANQGDDVVVVAPSALAGRGLSDLARHADVVILTVDSDQVRRAEAGRASLLVQRLGVPLVGIVVTGGAAEEDGWQPAAWPTPMTRSANVGRDEPVGALGVADTPRPLRTGWPTNSHATPETESQRGAS